jgi:glucose dehydrogenase
MYRGISQAGLLVSLVAALAVQGVVAQQQAAAPQITVAPAFTADQLLAAPTDNWITNGGGIFNQRYSPLKQINRDNVAGLKALWRTGMGSGTNFGNGGQEQIL